MDKKRAVDHVGCAPTANHARATRSVEFRLVAPGPPSQAAGASVVPVARRMRMSTAGDCLHCGVCCFSDLETYVRVTGADWARLGADAERVAHFIGHRAFMKMSDGHCAALQIRPDENRGAEGGTQFFCTIYERRPDVCRVLARGSPECEGEIGSKASRVASRPELSSR